ncbi:hypothetical protein HAX54_012775, partial [Datura stramonium]|nr:hypothetical protein [Datura stramonium]
AFSGGYWFGGTAAAAGFPLQQDYGSGQSLAVAELGSNHWNRRSDTIAVLAGLLQRKCDRCNG